MEANYGFLSVIPAILVIVLALKTKKTLLSLMIGGYVGAVILNGWNPLIALPNMMCSLLLREMPAPWCWSPLPAVLSI